MPVVLSSYIAQDILLNMPLGQLESLLISTRACMSNLEP